MSKCFVLVVMLAFEGKEGSWSLEIVAEERDYYRDSTEWQEASRSSSAALINFFIVVEGGGLEEDHVTNTTRLRLTDHEQTRFPNQSNTNFLLAHTDCCADYVLQMPYGRRRSKTDVQES
jgi:hypothetical protein